MPTLLQEIPGLPIVPAAPPRNRWTREQCAAAEASGVFRGETIELIDGELINTMGKKPPDSNTLTAMLICLQGVFGARFVNTERPIDVHPGDNPINEPEPDLIVLTSATGA